MASVKTTITEQGLALIDSIINGSGELAFTGIEIGDGENINSSALVTELINKRMDVVISKVYASEDGTIVCGNVDNSTVTESFEIREVGVFAKKDGSENAPILFAYTECEGIGGIPAASIVAINNEMLITLATGNANVIYADNPTAALTRQDIVELRKILTENYFTKSDIRSGVQTQTVFGYDPLTGEDTKNAMYLTGNTIRVMIDGKEIAFPVEAGTLALKSELDGKANKTHTHDVGEINATLALYEEANNSTRGSNERHGKVIFVTNDADNGGIYIGGSRSTRITWTQWLSRFQWDKIRAYGNTNGQYEDYVLTPQEDGSNADKQIARMQDLAGKQDKLTAGENITIENGVISATGGGSGIHLNSSTGHLSISDDNRNDLTIYSDGSGGYVHTTAMGSNSPTPLTFVTQALLDRISNLEQSDGSVTVDTELIDGSTNPVAGGAVKEALDYKADYSMSATIGDGAFLDAKVEIGGFHVIYSGSESNGLKFRFVDTIASPVIETDITVPNTSVTDSLAERIEALENAPSTGGGFGINPANAENLTATQTYDETSGYTYTKDVTATENGYLSCQASQTHETEGNNKIILTCSINGTVIHKDCANGYGDMASILIPVANGQTVNVQATSTEPATVEIKFMPLN